MNLAKRWGALALASLVFGLSAVSAQTASAPVIAPIADIDTQFGGPNGDGTNTFHTLQISATNSPTQYSAQGLPPLAQLDPTTGVISWDDSSGGGGLYTVSVTASNAYGTSAPKTFQWRVHPAIYDNGIFLSPGYYSFDGYASGQTLVYKADFSAPVYVTGSPYLSVGKGQGRAYYSSGSGTARLTFTYVPKATEGSFIEAVPTSIELNGGTIGTADGVSARVIGRHAPGTTPVVYAVVAPEFPDINANATVGVPFLSGFWSGRHGITLSLVSGALPPGVSIDNGIFAIDGTPTAAGTYSAVLNVANQYGESVNASVTISVAPGPGTPPAPLSTPTVTSVDQSATPTVRGTAAPFQYVMVEMIGSGGYLLGYVMTQPDGTWTYSWHGSPLQPGTYEFTAVTEAADRTHSAEAPRVSMTVPNPPPPPPPPLTITASGPDFVRLQWAAPTAGYDRLEVQRAVDGSAFVPTATWVSGAPTSGIDYNVGPGKSYSYRIATYVGGNVTYSNAVNVVTPTIVLSVGRVTGTLVELNMTANGASWGGGWLQKSSDGVNFPPWNFRWWGGPLSPLTPGTTYYFRIVTGLDETNPTGSSNIVKVTTASPDTFPPTALSTTLGWNKDTRVLEIAVKYSRAVVVTGAPTVATTVTSMIDWLPAPFAAGSGTDTLYFRITLPTQSGRVFTSSQINLHGGTIMGTDGSAVAVDIPESLGLFFIDAPSASQPSVPVVSNATVTGQVGTAITPVQVSATNSPTSFTADGLSAYGLAISATGLISGTPTAAANGVAVPVTATNAAGTSAPATITLNIQAAPVVNPPPVINPPPVVVPPPVVNPPPPGKQSQTITFTSPASGVVVGQPITLGATSSAGLPIVYTVVSGDADLNGNVLTPRSTATLVVRAASAGSGTYDAASTDVNFGNPQKAAQAISVVPVGDSVPAEKPLALAASSSSGLPVSYTVVSGPATITGNTVTFTGTGAVVVRASQSGSDTYAAASDVTLTLTAIPVTRLVNISSRLRVTANDASGASIAGFVVTGSAPKQMLIRAVGPSLSTFGVANVLGDPRLRIYDGTSKLIAENAGWGNDAAIASAAEGVGAFKFNAGSKDAALIVTLTPGAYTAQVSSTGNGVALIEVYDVAANAAVPTKQLINISTRGFVGTGDDALVAGFVVNGSAPKRVLIRAVGPALAAFGVSGVLADPSLKVYNASGVVVAENNDWGTASGDIAAANTAAGAFALGSGSKDAALVVELAPGAYTAVVTGPNGSTGTALVEVYELP